MILIYRDMAKQLAEAVHSGYKGGLASIVKLNKKNILRLSEPDKPSLFKIYYTGTDKAMIQNFVVEAFTVAAVNSYECEEKLKTAAAQIMQGDHPYLKAHPGSDIKTLWHDEAYNILSDYIEVADAPPPGVLTTNLRTAVTSSFMASQWQRLQGVKDIYLAYQYKTREDNRVREAHRALDNKIFSSSDPIWDTIYPPNGWNCRCYITPLDQGELGAADSNDVIDIASEEQRSEYIKHADVSKDFSRNSGQTGSIWGKWIKEKLNGKNLRAIKQKLNEYADAIHENHIDNKTFAEDNSVCSMLASITVVGKPIQDKKDKVKMVLNNPEEIWGEVYNYGQRQHEINFIRYNSDNSFTVVKVNKAIAYAIEDHPLSDLSKYRIGVFINE